MMKITEQFLHQIDLYLPTDEANLVLRALELASRVHQGYYRLNDEPYIDHVVSVASILAEWRAPGYILAAALLHDSGKASYATVPSPETLRAVAGERAARIVKHIARLGRYGPAYHGEIRQHNHLRDSGHTTLPWAAIVLRQEPAAIIVKIADRIDNFRTLHTLPRNRRRAFAKSVRTIFIPFAQSLGMRQARRILEDGAFRILEPENYQRAEKQSRKRRLDPRFTESIARLREHLQKQGLQVTVQHSPTSLYELYRQQTHAAGAAAHLFPPVLILVEDEAACYQVLRFVHQLWPPRSGAIHDYIAAPKPNGFRSLQTQVKINNEDYIFIDIRDPWMNLVSEFGVTARWQGAPAELTPQIPRFSEPPAGKIAVFTPEGESKILPEKATPVDFAYAIHPELGHQCSAAEVNGRPAPLDTELQSGDLVRILTSATRIGPSLTWLDFVKSPKAKREIRKWHTKRSANEARKHGQKLLDDHLRKLGVTLSAKDVQMDLSSIAQKMNYASLDDLYVAIGVGRRPIESVVDQYLRFQRRGPHPLRPSATILSLGFANLPHKLARCCNPRPPDQIVGYITKDNHVSIHRADCKNLQRLHPIFAAEWNTSLDHQITQIDIEAVDRLGLIRDVSSLIAEMGLSMFSFHADRISDGSARIQMVFESISLETYAAIKEALSAIPDVRNVRAAELTMPSKLARGAIVERLFLNPYTLHPATGKNFVGRTQELQDLVNKLRGIRPGQAVLVWGPRRIGKTSLLLQFQRNILSHADYAIAFLSLHQISGQSMTSFLFEILKAIAARSHPDGLYAPRYHRMKRDPLGYFNNFIQKRLPQSPRHIVLIFDEFQRIADIREDKITLQDINHYFRSLIQQNVALTIIFSGGGILSDLQKKADTVSLLEVAEYLPIKRLNENDARELITEPAIRVSYDDTVVDRLVKLTAGHPYFLQLICSDLYDYAIEHRLTRINLSHLDSFLGLLWMKQAEHYFSHLWGDGVISDPKQIERYKFVLLSLGLYAEPGEWIPYDTLLHSGITQFLTEKQLWSILQGLRHLDSLDVRHDDEIRMSIEFAHRWIKHNYSTTTLRRGLQI